MVLRLFDIFDVQVTHVHNEDDAFLEVKVRSSLELSLIAVGEFVIKRHW
jgi:hypothetical protein